MFFLKRRFVFVVLVFEAGFFALCALKGGKGGIEGMDNLNGWVWLVGR